MQRLTRSAFTLIELLVVVAIISLLVSVLLPALQKAREQANTVVCASNLRQLMLAFHLYQHEYGCIPGSYYQGVIDLDWGGRVNAKYEQNPQAWKHPFDTSVLSPFVAAQDNILECPTGQREANTWYDFTIVVRMAGAHLDVPWRASWAEVPSDAENTQRFFNNGIPLMIEEDEYWYNEQVDDGSWGNNDQFSQRHNAKGNVGFFDGSVSLFKSPKGPGGPGIQDQGDLKAKHLRVWAKDKRYKVAYTDASEFGWVNNPTD